MYYVFNDMISIEDFDSILLRIDKQSFKNVGIYNIGYIKIKKVDDYENIHSVNPFYLTIGKVIVHIKEKNESKYLVFNSADENKEVLKKYKELWDGIKNKIESINGGKTSNMVKISWKIKFDSDDDLPLNKQLKFPTMTIAVRSVLEEDGKFYLQAYLNKCLYEL